MNDCAQFAKQFRSLLLVGTLWQVSIGCSPAEHGEEIPTGRRNLVLITVDTLRADHVSAYGYPRDTTPNIDRLANQGIRFANALVPRSETWPALTSILTGTQPRTHGVRANGIRLDASQETLIEQLQEAGFATAAFLTNMTTAPNRGLDTLQVWPQDPRTRIPDYEADAQATQAAQRWLRDHASERFVLWLHLLGPHEPYEPDPARRRRYATGYEGAPSASRSTLVRIHRAKRAIEPDELAHYVSLYDEEISAIDEHVGALLAEIDTAGLRDETLVVFAGDHGEELYEHDFYFLHSYSLSRAVLRIPLILRLPGQLPEGRVVDGLVQAIDIAPTVLSLLGLSIPAGVEGVDLHHLAQGDGPHPRSSPIAFAELGPEIHALQTAGWKYIHNPKGYSSPGTAEHGSGYFGFFRIAKEELYDLEADPGEHHNVALQHPEIVEALRERLDAWLLTGEEARPGAAMSEASRAELEALGYLEPRNSPESVGQQKEEAWYEPIKK